MNVPLWHHIGCLEDIYFVGDAVIDDTYTIVNHTIQKVNSGSITLHNRKITHVTYGDKYDTAKTSGMIGMTDYEDYYVIVRGYFMPNAITTTYVREPYMQRFLHNDSVPFRVERVFDVVCKNDSSYKADMYYMITPNHIICGHEEYFYQNGILIKKISLGQTSIFRYKEFDERGNWIVRDEFSESGDLIKTETRTINYIYDKKNSRSSDRRRKK